MVRWKKFLVAAALLLQTGCLYLDTKVPLDTDVSVTKLGSKVGVSSMQSVLWLIAWGDASTAAAARNGDITTINHLDSRTVQYLFGVYSRVDTIAYGD